MSIERIAIRTTLAACLVLSLAACNGYKTLPPEMTAETPVTAAPWGSGPEAGKSAEAFLQAAAAGKHLLLYFFSSGKDGARYRKVLESSLAKMEGKAQSFPVNVKDAAEKTLVERYKLQQAPLPLILVVAPNGAVLGGFPQDQIVEERVTNSLASPCLQRCMKSLQEGKLIMLCERRPKNAGDAPRVPKGVLDFANDGKYKAQTRIVTIDPNDPAEKNFVAQLKIDPTAGELSTCILAPPGSLLTTVKGPIRMKALELAIQKASAGGGCCPGGAKPGAACPPAKK